MSQIQSSVRDKYAPIIAQNTQQYPQDVVEATIQRHQRSTYNPTSSVTHSQVRASASPAPIRSGQQSPQQTSTIGGQKVIRESSRVMAEHEVPNHLRSSAMKSPAHSVIHQERVVSHNPYGQQQQYSYQQQQQVNVEPTTINYGSSYIEGSNIRNSTHMPQHEKEGLVKSGSVQRIERFIKEGQVIDEKLIMNDQQKQQFTETRKHTHNRRSYQPPPEPVRHEHIEYVKPVTHTHTTHSYVREIQNDEDENYNVCTIF